jgi:ribosome maturation factor RimP
MENKELEILVAGEVDSLGFECVKCEVVGSKQSPVVRLYIDGPDGVDIDDCSMVSRAIGLVLDENDPFPGRYLLEVSSPGSERPLTTEAHFQRFAGSEAKVPASVPGGGRTTYTGRIRSCINGVLTLDTEDGPATIALEHVAGAHLIHQEYKIDKKRKKEKRQRRGGRSR